MCTTFNKPSLHGALISLSLPQLDAQEPLGNHLLEIVEPQDGRSCITESWSEGELLVIRNIHLWLYVNEE